MRATSTGLAEEYESVSFSLEHHGPMDVLFRSAFGQPLSKDTFLNRYNTAPVGKAVVGYIAFHRATGTPAAYYGVFPVQLQYGGRTCWAAQSGDTMTHGDHRKRGLFTWLAKLTYEACTRQGIELVFGMPNANSYPGFINKLGWKETDTIACYDLKPAIKTFPLPKLLPRFAMTWARLVLRRYVRNAVGAQINTCKTDYAKVFRDAAYMKYKDRSDSFLLELDGILIWVRLTDVFWIGEVSDYDRLSERIVLKLQRIAFVLGYNTIRYHLNSSINRPGFLRSFKKYNNEPFCYLDLSGRYQALNILITAIDFDTW